MATIQEIAPAPWRMRLVPASYAGVRFHVEQQARNSGRRVVLHEYPKRDDPYSEDMGRHAVRYQITGYLVGPRYHEPKKELIRALENKQGGQLMDPYLAEPLMCICERYSVTETRVRGGFCTFDMSFVELGKPGNEEQRDSQGDVNNQANKTGTDAATNADGASGVDEGGFVSAFGDGGSQTGDAETPGIGDAGDTSPPVTTPPPGWSGGADTAPPPGWGGGAGTTTPPGWGGGW